MTAVLHVGDVLQTEDHQLHTVAALPDDGPPAVTEWTGQQPHPLTGQWVRLYDHHSRGAR